MKKNLILFVLGLAGSVGMMQAKEVKRESRKIKAEVSKQDTIHASALDALTHCHFVLQAEEVINKYGVKAETDPVANFVAMKGPVGVVQLAYSVEGTPCGVTMEGRVGQMNIEEDRKGNTICTFNIDSPLRTMSLRLTLSKKNDEAFVEISSCKHVKGIAFSGRLLYGADASILIGEPS